MSHFPQSLSIGATGSATRVITDQTVRDFASLSGDTQPLHIDDDYASDTRFKRRVAHGALLVGMISAVLGVKMADDSFTVIFLGLEVSFTSPVYIGDEITAKCEVIETREDKPIVTLKIACGNADSEEVMSGRAIVYVDPHPVNAL